MFIRTSDIKGRKYLSVAEKVKDSDGNWKTKVISGIGYVDNLEKVYPDPKAFFKELLSKIQEEMKKDNALE